MKENFIICGFLAASILAFIFPYQQRIAKPNASKEYIYSYRSEGAGYSDIESMYSPDTLTVKAPFFTRKTLKTTAASIQCNIKKTIIESTFGEQWVCFQFILPKIKIGNEQQSINTDLVEKELVKPVFAKMTRTGEIRKVKIDGTITQTSAGIIKEILANLQFLLPNKDNSSWQTLEESASGTYKAKYKQIGRIGNGWKFLKTNEGYTKLKSANKNHSLHVTGPAFFLTDSLMEVNAIQLAEVKTYLVNSDTISLSNSRTSLRLKTKKSASGDDLLAYKNLFQASNYSDESSLSEPLSEEKLNRLAYRNTLGNDNLHTLLNQLEKANGQDDKEEEQLILKLRALAYLEPSACRVLGSVLRREKAGSIRFRILFNALALTETTSSINELAGLLNDRKGDEQIALQVLPILATTGVPTNEAIKIVKGLAFEQYYSPSISSTAQLTLGGFSYNLKASNPVLAEQLAGYLIDKFKGRTDTLQQVLVFGNTGSISVLTFLKALISNPNISDEIRSTAVHSLRNISNAEVDEFLLRLLSNKNKLIKEAASSTIASRKEYTE